MSSIQPPRYEDGNIVNLMASVVSALGAQPRYPLLGLLPPDELAAHRNIVLAVFDGLGHAYLQNRPQSFLFRHLRGRLSSVFPSTTASAVTTLMTGLAPQQHGVTGWFTYLKELGSVAAILPFRPRHGGPPYTRMGIDPTSIFTWDPLFNDVQAIPYIVTARYIADSDYSVATGGRATRRGYENLSGYFEQIRQIVTTSTQRTYVYAYWPNFDSLAHEFGIGSAPAAEHFRELDSTLEQFMASVSGTDTLVIVCADHGLIDTTPDRTLWLDTHPALARTLALPLCGEPRAAYCYVRPERRRQFERYVASELDAYCTPVTAEDLLAAGFFGPGSAHPRLGDRVGDYVLLMKENYAIKDRVLGEGEFVQIGVHGGLSEQELFVPLTVLKA